MVEEKRIPGFEDYSVTSDGRVFSYKWHRKKEKVPRDRNGHLSVDFCKHSYRYHRSVAMLVAKAFIPKPEVSRMVRHKDGNLRNNDMSNLEWIINEDRLFGYC